ncbi:MAG TPA: helix-turn-helix domain-containing protein [Albidovulum sp.]|uniref:IclR family transcriptional regulator n=1 Tax=Albidovulum sp. TaxID=1872424 RepID=UPI002C5471A6|nr:helix-turn-helix domain-containing protein [Albidovulum sp.]
MTDVIEKPAKSIATLDKALRVMATISRTTEDLRIADLVRLTGIDRSGVQRLIRTLEVTGLVAARSASGRVLPGIGAMRYGYAFLAGNPLIDAAMPLLVDLNSGIAAGCDLWLADEGDLVHVARVPSAEGGETMAATGRRMSGAIGPLLAAAPEGWVDGPDDPLTRRISAPIFGEGGSLLGAVSIDRLGDSDLARLGTALARTARDISGTGLPLTPGDRTGGQAATLVPRAEPETDPLVIDAVIRAFQLLDCFSPQASALTLTDLHRASGFGISMVQRLTDTLLAAGYLRRDKVSKTFSLGTRVLDLVHGYQSRTAVLKFIWPRLVALRRQTGLRTSFCVLDGSDILYLLHVQGASRSNYRTAFVGRRLPALSTSGGRALLSRLGTPELDRFFARFPIRPITPFTVIDPSVVRREIMAAAVEGIAYTDQQSIMDEVNVAIAIEVGSEPPVGAIVVSAPRPDWDRERLTRQIVPALVNLANGLRQLAQ